MKRGINNSSPLYGICRDVEGSSDYGLGMFPVLFESVDTVKAWMWTLASALAKFRTWALADCVGGEKFSVSVIDDQSLRVSGCSINSVNHEAFIEVREAKVSKGLRVIDFKPFDGCLPETIADDLVVFFFGRVCYWKKLGRNKEVSREGRKTWTTEVGMHIADYLNDQTKFSDPEFFSKMVAAPIGERIAKASKNGYVGQDKPITKCIAEGDDVEQASELNQNGDDRRYTIDQLMQMGDKLAIQKFFAVNEKEEFMAYKSLCGRNAPEGYLFLTRKGKYSGDSGALIGLRKEVDIRHLLSEPRRVFSAAALFD